MKSHLFSVCCAALLATPISSEPLETFQDCNVCPVMIELPLGEFIMGAPQDEFRRRVIWRDGALRPIPQGEVYPKLDEGPQGRVQVDIRIAMSRDEVTYVQWMACANAGGCNGHIPRDRIFRMGSQNMGQEPYFVGGDHPVLHVNIEDAEAYVEWLNQVLGTSTYRLPTEAEWEYAARAKTTTRFAQGDELSSSQANFSGEATEVNLIEDRPDLMTRGVPVPVNVLDAANAWGLRHMSGNAAEMTASCYSREFIAHPTTSLWLLAAENKVCEDVAIRGGNFASAMDNQRVAWRGLTRPHFRTKFVGFRVVKSIQ